MDKLATVTRVEQDFSPLWMKENPALFVAAVLKFVVEHPPEKWTLSITNAYMPGASIMFVAKRKDA
jgi:hypothetical protein